MNIESKRVIKWMDYVRYQNHLSQKFSNAFFPSQLKSKEWLIQILATFMDQKPVADIYVLGGWFGILPQLLRDNKTLGSAGTIYSVDKDPSCASVLNQITYKKDNIVPVIHRLETFEYPTKPDIIINTICEHISQEEYDMWLDKCPINTLIVLQSNNLEIDEHVNTSSSLSEFEDKCGLQVLYKNELELKDFTRYMIIGRKR